MTCVEAVTHKLLTLPRCWRQGLLADVPDMPFNVQSQLRKQLLEHLRASEPGDPPAARRAATIQEQALNTLFAEYLAATQRTCTLSVFLPEADLDSSVPLTHQDMMTVLHIQPSSPMFAPFSAALKKAMPGHAGAHAGCTSSKLA